jgi:Fe-S cluster assembly ATPase SufC
MGQMGTLYKVMVGKPETKLPRGRAWFRGRDVTKMDIKVIGCENVRWIYLA